MALKALLLRSRLDKKKAELEELRKKDDDLKKREADLEAAIGDMNEDTSDEDRAEVEKQVEDLEKEKEEHEKEKEDLEKVIEAIEEELCAEEEKQPEERNKRYAQQTGVERRTAEMPRTVRRIEDMTIQERTAFLADEQVEEFIKEVRTCIKEKRALTNAGLLIPDIMLPMIRQKSEETSKLLKYVTQRSVGGTSRQNIMGEIPEAFWDEMCAPVKELSLEFYNHEMDGYKVSGYFVVCNAVLEDSDINLASEIISAIGSAIGKAIDKAIIYGKGVKMPMGIVTSLLKAEAPEGYPTTGRAWEDLSETHVITGTATTGLTLFQEIVKKSGIVENDYSTEDLVWIMNNTTKTKLVAESMGVNAAAAIVAGTGNTMPVVGGAIETFKYIPDNTVIFGYFKNYLYVHRSGLKLAQSEHVKFIEDQTAFKGTERADGKPVIREAFAIMGIGGAPDTKAPLFAGETPTQLEG